MYFFRLVCLRCYVLSVGRAQYILHTRMARCSLFVLTPTNRKPYASLTVPLYTLCTVLLVLSLCIGDISERVLPVSGTDSAAGVDTDAQRAHHQVAAGVQAASSSQLAGTVQRAIRDQHQHRHGCHCPRAGALSHARPCTTGKLTLHMRLMTHSHLCSRDKAHLRQAMSI